MSDFSIFFIVQSGASSILYLILLVSFRKLKKAEEKSFEYEVFGKKDKIAALRNPDSLRWFYGLLYAGLFYAGLPILIWRYGFKQSLWLILLPVICAFGGSFILGDYVSVDGLSIIALILIKPLAGMYLYVNDWQLRRNIVLERGWTSHGEGEGVSRKEVIKGYLGQNFVKTS
jgi:hypothetical protein